MALAFGLGGRDVAARMLEGAYQAGQQNREQVKRDLQQGRERAREEIDQKRAEMDESPIEGDVVRSPSQEDPVAFEPDVDLDTQVNPPAGGRPT
jgi:hypothetical protein